MRFNWILIFACFLLLVHNSCTRSKGNVQLSAGASAAPINPPIGSYIAGHTQNRKFKAIHDNLMAKAVVLSDGRETVAILTLDCIGLLKPEIDKISSMAARESGVPVNRIIVSSTHTHAGPDVVGIWGPDYQHSGVDSVYMDFLVRTAADQIIKAYENRVPVTLRAAAGQYEGRWFDNICKEELDRNVSVIALKDQAGSMVATLTNFACHPTFLDANFDVVSADFPAGFYDKMNKNFSGVHLYLQGPIGGWVQPIDENPSIELASQRGREFAEYVIQLIGRSEQQDNSEIEYAETAVVLPVENLNWRKLSSAGIIKREFKDSVRTKVSWLAIGDVRFATHPGETTPWLGLETRKMLKGKPGFVLGLSQDALGYILKPEFFTDKTRLHADYLTSMSLGPKTSQIILESLERIIPEE
jgi:hypothetical protein